MKGDLEIAKNHRDIILTTIPAIGARGVMVIIVGYGHGDTSSNPGPD